MGKVECLDCILAFLLSVFLFGVYNVRIRGKVLRRTANLDLALLAEHPEKRKALEQALNGFIMIESAFASVTGGIFFIFVGMLATNRTPLESPDFEIASCTTFCLGTATISWILSLEQLSHMISPSLDDRVFGNLYKEAFNLWNLGLMLLMFSIPCALLLVNSYVALAVGVISLILCMRSLYFVHAWDEGDPPKTFPRIGAFIANKTMTLLPAARARTFAFALLCLVLFPLYQPLNVARQPLHYLGTQLDAKIPFVPVFAVPYVSYFVFLASTVILLLVRKRRRRLDSWLLSVALTMAVAYLFYGFFQTEVPRPQLATTGDWTLQLVAKVYSNDNPYNAFPSLHTALSVACVWAMWDERKLRYAWLAWAAAILASTLLIKQHVLADMVFGAFLASATFCLSYRALPDNPEQQP